MAKEMTKERYSKMVDSSSPNSPVVSNCIRAFIVGGIICTIGEVIMNISMLYGADTESAGMYTSVILVITASILTGLGIYSKIGKFAGAGSIVPITGFSNSVTSPAIEFKKEGYILGLGAKIFIIAGPVILYGALASVVVGLVYYFAR